jgi:hypothetical protein
VVSNSEDVGAVLERARARCQELQIAPRDEAYDAARAEVGRLEGTLAEAVRQEQALADSTAVTDVDKRATEILEAREYRGRVTRALELAREKQIIVGDMGLAARRRRRRELSEAAYALARAAEAAKQSNEARALEYRRLADLILASLPELSDEMNRFVRLSEKNRIDVQRVVIEPATADPFQPSTPVLVKPSAWRRVVEDLRRRQIARAALSVDEATGEIVKVVDNPIAGGNDLYIGGQSYGR